MLQKNLIRNDKKGFSLIETMIAMGILGIIAVMTMAVFIQQMNYGKQEGNRRTAINLMDDYIEKIYRVDIDQISQIVNNGGFDETYGDMEEYPNFSRRIIALDEQPTIDLSYNIQVEIRWKYKDGTSPPYTQWITKTRMGGK